MTSALIAQAAALIERRTGLAVGTHFKHELGGLLTQIAGGAAGLGALLTSLQTQPESAPVWQAVIAMLTIGETHFLRDRAHISALRTQILPALIAQKRQAGSLALTVWSAGCSTGEEPYTLAILLTELLPDAPRWMIRIVGTDLNLAALEKANSAVYRQWAFRHTGEDFQQRYFDRGEHGLRIKPAIRRMVAFRQHNIVRDTPLPQCDLILCRNVLLYLNKAAVAQIESHLFGALNAGGWLLLGQAEALYADRERWLTHIFPGAVSYQKPFPSQRGQTITHYDVPSPTSPLRKTDHVKPTAPLNKLSTNTVAALPQGGTYSEAVDAMHRSRPDEAERILADVLAQHPDDPKARTLLACIFANRGALPEAHTHLDLALRKDPLLADAHYLRAMLHLEGDQPDAAEKELRAALYCQQRHPLAALMLGNFYGEGGDLPRARRAWLQAREAVHGLPRDFHLCDLSDMTAEELSVLVEVRLRS